MVAPGSLDHLSSHSPDHLRLLWRSFPSNPNQTPARGNVGGLLIPQEQRLRFANH